MDHYLSKTEKLFKKLEKEIKSILDTIEYNQRAVALEEYHKILGHKEEAVSEGVQMWKTCGQEELF